MYRARSSFQPGERVLSFRGHLPGADFGVTHEPSPPSLPGLRKPANECFIPDRLPGADLGVGHFLHLPSSVSSVRASSMSGPRLPGADFGVGHSSSPPLRAVLLTELRKVVYQARTLASDTDVHLLRSLKSEGGPRAGRVRRFSTHSPPVLFETAVAISQLSGQSATIGSDESPVSAPVVSTFAIFPR
jgi:hypothetical protein